MEKIIKNILSRRNKGIALINEINTILSEMMLGDEHFEVSVLLRNAILASSLLFNSETWYNISKSDIKMLESVDERYMRKILNCPVKTPKCIMYLELGLSPLRFTIQSRRLNFLKYILDQSEESLIKNVFLEQKSDPKRGDWVSTVRKDLKKLKIELTFDEIKNMSKYSLKNVVSEKCKSASLFYLKNQVKEKGKEIKYSDLKMQTYLSKYSILTQDEKKGAFLIRSRMSDVKTNMKQKYSNVLCVACEKENIMVEETQEHILECKTLNSGNKISNLKSIYTNNMHEIKKIVNNFYTNMKKRESYINNCK